ncbi:hypothetical protein EST38_g6286 [Candolleomyces aberdarensis]|uniref:Uncharacterized protein n=1 Tax=Candolleomyces aberdarensis TaxID=2316362 RepID=A0A4Q2DLB4_9AGAR|nr:hypothetical protein EST38_g6286 [Candolleomyces aberdarensis]
MLSFVTRRDLVEHELFSRDLQAHGLVTREEIEELFGRDMDSEVSDLFERKQATLNQIHSRHPEGAVNLFQSIGDFVKRCASGYWKHMIRKAHLLVGQSDGKDELDFLPREEGSKVEQVPQHSDPSWLSQDTSWFGKALNAYRDTVLLNNPGIPEGNRLSSREDDDFSSHLTRDLFDELLEERDFDHSGYEVRGFGWSGFEERDLDELYLEERYFDEMDLEERDGDLDLD